MESVLIGLVELISFFLVLVDGMDFNVIVLSNTVN